ncbi:unnamed protein product [Darwinula stevensoni]|uniref:Uncharacterized protein n=1 Tax=Darwinula stevensoni TaxID=69355 RepID=A0A7R8XJD7_9CRUS|nr:unnamed protein product [Darwinula stevensoni]CAG0892102.1 unnamed protein product [Darwinula stevensoni]
MVWVYTFYGLASTRKGSVVIATLALTLAIPSLILIGLDLRSFLAYAQNNAMFNESQLRTYKAIMITAILLLASYAISSFILMVAAEKNLKTMHLPWLILHPLVTVSLLALLIYVAWLIGYDYNMNAVGRINTLLLIFSIFISFWILTCLWVVVVSNYQRLATATDGYAAPLNQTDEWHQLEEGLRKGNDQYHHDNVDGYRFGTLAIPLLILLGLDLRSFLAYAHNNGFNVSQLRTYKAITITAISLLTSYAVRSFILMIAAEKVSQLRRKGFQLTLRGGNCRSVAELEDDALAMAASSSIGHRRFHDPLVYVAWLIGYDYNISVLRRICNILMVFCIFISFWIMTYIWVAVMSNYQGLGSAHDDYTAPPLSRMMNGTASRMGGRRNIIDTVMMMVMETTSE